MVIDDRFIDECELISSDKKFLKKYNNIYISEEQKNILDKYNINVNNYVTVNQLIYDIEEYLNNSIEELSDLEWVSESISEYNYYNNTNK